MQNSLFLLQWCQKTVASTHCVQPWRDGQAELAWVAGYLPRWYARPKTVTSLGLPRFHITNAGDNPLPSPPLFSPFPSVFPPFPHSFLPSLSFPFPFLSPSFLSPILLSVPFTFLSPLSFLYPSPSFLPSPFFHPPFPLYSLTPPLLIGCSLGAL